MQRLSSSKSLFKSGRSRQAGREQAEGNAMADGNRPKDPASVASRARERLAKAKRVEANAHRRAAELHEQTAELQERLGTRSRPRRLARGRTAPMTCTTWR
jgi:hypothetical protein